jgi:hypothetical protein
LVHLGKVFELQSRIGYWFHSTHPNDIKSLGMQGLIVSLWSMIHKLGHNISCRLVPYDKVYGSGNTSLFEVGNRHEAWQGSIGNPNLYLYWNSNWVLGFSSDHSSASQLGLGYGISFDHILVTRVILLT